MNRKFTSKGTSDIISNAHKINNVEKMFGGYTEVYVLQKIICAPHEENSSPERKKNPPPCHINVPMIYTKHVNCNCVDDK